MNLVIFVKIGGFLVSDITWPLSEVVTNGREANKEASVGRAVKILGKDKVCEAADVAKVWDKKLRDGHGQIGYSVELLGECAAENATGIADWRLTYHLGQNLEEMYIIRGDDKKRQPCFLPAIRRKDGKKSEGSEWFPNLHILHPLNTTGFESWDGRMAERKAEYWLTNFNPLYSEMKWEEQEKLIRSVPFQIRTDIAVFCETLMSIFMLKGARLFKNHLHWTNSKYRGYYLAAGRFIPYGLFIKECWPGHWGLAVSVSKKHDIVSASK